MENQNHEPVDTCYCPAGVAFRISELTRFALYFGVAYLIVQMLALLASGLQQLGRAAGSLNWEAVGIVGAGILTGLALFFIWFVNAFSLKDERKKAPLRRFRKARRYLMQRDLKRQFSNRPQLATVTVEEILQEMNEEHPPEEVISDPKMLLDYAQAFEKVKSWHIGQN